MSCLISQHYRSKYITIVIITVPLISTIEGAFSLVVAEHFPLLFAIPGSSCFLHVQLSQMNSCAPFCKLWHTEKNNEENFKNAVTSFRNIFLKILVKDTIYRLPSVEK